MTIDLNKVSKYWTDATEHLGDGQLEWIANASEQDMAKLYADLNTEEIKELKNMVAPFYDPSLPDIDNIDPGVFKEYFQESIHNSWDGWEPVHVTVLIQLMHDIRRYAEASSPKRPN